MQTKTNKANKKKQNLGGNRDIEINTHEQMPTKYLNNINIIINNIKIS